MQASSKLSVYPLHGIIITETNHLVKGAHKEMLIFQSKYLLSAIRQTKKTDLRITV
jgi:hypothetical protein